MNSRLNINVSATDYDSTRNAINKTLSLLEQRIHGEGEFVMTDSEFAFGWHFFVLGVNRSMINELAQQMGPNFEKLDGRGTDKKFLTWLTGQVKTGVPRFKLAIKEEMESSKFGIF